MVIAPARGGADFVDRGKSNRFTSVDQMPPSNIKVTTGRVKIPVRGSRGLRFIKPFSGGSTESAKAGKPSVARFTYRICTAVSGSGSPSSADPAINPISPIFDDSRYIRYFLMLPNT